MILVLGEKCDVRLEVNLEQPLEKICDILVLHLVGGKDMFITVSGECQRSCFTTSIATLCRTPVPLLRLSPEQLENAVSIEANYHYLRANFLLLTTNCHSYN